MEGAYYDAQLKARKLRRKQESLARINAHPNVSKIPLEDQDHPLFELYRSSDGKEIVVPTELTRIISTLIRENNLKLRKSQLIAGSPSLSEDLKRLHLMAKLDHLKEN